MFACNYERVLNVVVLLFPPMSGNSIFFLNPLQILTTQIHSVEAETERYAY
jgi:hypothetical protein